MVRFKRGAAFKYAGVAKVNGVVQDMTGWSIACQIRVYDPSTRVFGALIADIPSGFLDAVNGVVYVGDLTSTVAWPLGFAAIDLVYTAPGGQPIKTNSVVIYIEEGATQP